MLLGFCGAFIALLYATGSLNNDAPPDITEFSPPRIRADRSLSRKDWTSARANLLQMINNDPYDGRAHFLYANTFYREHTGLFEQLTNLDPSDPGYRDVKDRYNQNYDSATAALIKAKPFARYRGRALIYLAVLEMNVGKPESALTYLREFVETGNYTPNGLDTYQVFGFGGQRMTVPGVETTPQTRLHSVPQFWELVRIENENRS